MSVVWSVVCGVVWHAENPVCRFKTPPSVHSKTSRVCQQHAHMLDNMCACCQHERGRFECTHEGVLNGHTGGLRSVPVTKKSPRRILTCAREVRQRNPWMLPILSLRIDREQHVPDSSNQSLYLIKLFNSSSPQRHCGENQPPDGSVCLSPPKPKHNERFTRQTLSMMFGYRNPLTFHNGFTLFSLHLL